MSTKDDPSSGAQQPKRRLPSAGGNGRQYLWMIFGGVAASGSTKDHLWSWRLRLVVFGLLVMLFVLLWVIAGRVH